MLEYQTEPSQTRSCPLASCKWILAWHPVECESKVSEKCFGKIDLSQSSPKRFPASRKRIISLMACLPVAGPAGRTSSPYRTVKFSRNSLFYPTPLEPYDN